MTIVDEIRAFVRDSLYADAGLTDDASLLETGTIDSTGVLELIAFVEQRFEIEVRDGEILPAYFDSIERIAVFVEKKRAGGIGLAR